MGNLQSFLCLSGVRSKSPDLGSCIARQLSPIPSLRHLKPKPASRETLQDICVAVVASNYTSLDVNVLPAELNQRVVDLLCDLGEVQPDLLPRMCVPWLYGLRLADYPGCCDAWLAAAGRCAHLMTLDLTNCNMITDVGLTHVGHLTQLRQLLLVNCCQITDAGLAHVSGLTRLRELSLAGCDAITSAGCAALAPLTCLQRLNLAQCGGLDGAALLHLIGLQQLEELSLGWCRQLGTTVTRGTWSAATSPTSSSSSGSSYHQAAALSWQLAGLPALPFAAEVNPTAAAAAAAAAAAGGQGAHGFEEEVEQYPPHHHQHLPPLLSATVLTSLAPAAMGPPTTTTSSSSSMGLSRSAPVSIGKGRHCHCHHPQQQLLLHTAVLGPLAALTGLRRLVLAYSRVTGQQLEEVGACLPPGLLALDLSGNVGVTPRGLAALWGRAPTLVELHLRGVKVGNGAGPRALAGLTGLRHLDLAAAEVGDAGLAALAPLTALTYLDLDMCDLSDEGCQALKSFQQLRHLDLSETRLSDAGAAVLRHLPQLRRLLLSNTALGDAGVAYLTGLRQLQVLHLDTRGVGDAALALLRPLAPTLRELDLNGGRITSRGTPALAGFSQLTRLDLGGGLLSDRAAADLAVLPALAALSVAQNSRLGDGGLRGLARGLGGVVESLNLSYTGVSDAGLALLAGMKALRVVSLTGTRVTPAGVIWLRRHAPSLLVKHSP